MSSDHTTPPVGQVAQDDHAAERLDEQPTTVERGGWGSVVTLDGDGFSIAVYADHGVDGGELHEGLAACFRRMALEHQLDCLEVEGGEDGV